MSGSCGEIRVAPSPPLRGEVRVPGDKSLSQRAVLLALMARGASELHGFLESGDTLSTLGAALALGATADRSADGVLTVTGAGPLLRPPREPLDLGNSGTGMRLLAGLLAAQPFESELTGDASLRKRPMGRIRDPLVRMGARIELMGPGGCAPIRIRGGNLRAIDYRLPVASAQVKSALLLAGLYAEGVSRITEPGPARDHTERMLRAAGATVRVDGSLIECVGAGPGGPSLSGRRWDIPGDFSSAAFWLTAAAMREGAEVTVRGVGLNPRRTALLDVLRRMGASVEIAAGEDAAGEPAGDVTVRGRGLRGVEVGGAEIPALIDELPLVAAAGACAEGATVIRDAAELRVKESDRIAVLCARLREAGVRVAEHPDGMTVWGPAKPEAEHPLECAGDHRIAMGMAVLAHAAGKPFLLRDTDCVQTSYPSFWDDFRRLGGHVG